MSGRVRKGERPVIFKEDGGRREEGYILTGNIIKRNRKFGTRKNWQYD